MKLVVPGAGKAAATEAAAWLWLWWGGRGDSVEQLLAYVFQGVGATAAQHGCMGVVGGRLLEHVANGLPGSRKAFFPLISIFFPAHHYKLHCGESIHVRLSLPAMGQAGLPSYVPALTAEFFRGFAKHCASGILLGGALQFFFFSNFPLRPLHSYRASNPSIELQMHPVNMWSYQFARPCVPPCVSELIVSRIQRAVVGPCKCTPGGRFKQLHA